jgi:cell division protein FtsQ
LRTEDKLSTPHSAVLEAPEESFASTPAAGRRSRPSDPPSRVDSPRDFGRDFEGDFASTLPDTSDDDPDPRRRKGGYRLRLSGRPLQLPKSTWGRVLSAIAFLIFLGVVAAVLAAVRTFFLHDPRFTVPSSSAIESTGNTHISRAQLLSVFGEDVDRNIFRIPLAERRAELESLPWVERATVMRLLPNHIRIAITERTPVAFVRQGSQIGMVDASGVLLDMPPDAPGDPSYSFPVVTGISANDPLSTRAARMRIYAAFTSELDSTGNRVSEKLSEVDLSNPEDVKALIPEGNSDILVHFGDGDFLARYMKFQAHLRQWLADHPNLASVDMRYQRQVVLEMKPDSKSEAKPETPPAASPATPAAAAPSSPKATAPTITKTVSSPSLPPASKPAAKAIKKPAGKPFAKIAKAPPAANPSVKAASKPAAKPAPAAPETWHMVVVKPHTKEAAALAARLKQAASAHPQQAAPQ